MWGAMKEKKLPFSFKKIGRWWGNNPKERREEEIDFIAFANEKAIFAECKWRNAPASEDVLKDLIRRSALFPHFKMVYYMLFSKSGFTQGLKDKAAEHSELILVDVCDMFFEDYKNGDI